MSIKPILTITSLLSLLTFSGCFIFGGKNVSTGTNWEISIVYKNSKGENLLDHGPGDDKVEGVLQLSKKTYDTLTLLGDDELHRVLYNKKEIPLPANIANSANFFFTVVK